MEILEKEKVRVQHARFGDAPWYGRKFDVVIGGAGGIGSWVALLLSRIGHGITLYDMDVVDEVNLAGQCYTNKHLGKPKVDAVKNICKTFSNEDIIIRNEKFTEETIPGPIMFSCFDNMKGRKVMFERWCQLVEAEVFPKEEMIFIDGRMSAETGQVYFVTPDRIKQYEETLFDDSEVGDLPCSYKATTHNGTMIASQIVSGFNNFVTNIKEKDIRVLPFSMKYMLELLVFNKDD